LATRCPQNATNSSASIERKKITYQSMVAHIIFNSEVNVAVVWNLALLDN
jgi:hypothetical protein